MVLIQPQTILFIGYLGKSARGAYSTCIADEVAKADGIRSINDMHISAVKALKRHPDYKWCTGERLQIPQYIDTLDKKLILPPAAAHLDIEGV